MSADSLKVCASVTGASAARAAPVVRRIRIKAKATRDFFIFSPEKFSFVLWLPNYFYGELNFSRRGCCPCQHPRSRKMSCGIEDAGMVRGNWWREVGVIENVENLRTELDVEGFRDLRDVIVLEYREIKVG